MEPPPPEESEAPTRNLAAGTAPTRVLGGEEPVTPAVGQPVRRRAAPPPRRPLPPEPGKRSGASRFARAVGFVLLVLVLAGLIAGAVLLLTNSGSKTDVAQWIKSNVPDQVNTLIQFIKDHTGG
jgi:hypothetical protein